MLQQTQTDRVREKYIQFLREFPSLKALAAASPAAVLRAWSGLGYNRRALNLHRAAKLVLEHHQGRLPRTTEALRALPGLGAYSASAIRCFAWNEPDVFIETNIRAVFLHEFFKEKRSVADAELWPIIEVTIDRRDPRRWYYALMDYGSTLKRRYPDIGKRSRHYVRQSPFAGSRRQLRGKVIKHLTVHQKVSILKLAQLTNVKLPLVKEVLESLRQEEFLTCTGGIVRLC